MNPKRFIGLDAGSVSVKIVLLNGEGCILESHYIRHYGQPLKSTLEILEKLGDAEAIGITGSAGKLIAQIIGIEPINEIIAHVYALRALHPEARTVIELGGEDSKFIILENGKVKDLSMNSICAAGTGAFLDQQAERLGLRIEDEFGELALRSENPPRIAGRCSVFAKSDMIHLQQIATPDYDIVAGLCLAVARNFKGTICRGKKLLPPVIFLGGVAANKGMVRAFREIFGFNDREFIVPEYYALMGAIGAGLIQIEKGVSNYSGTYRLKDYLSSLPPYHGEGLKPLIFKDSSASDDNNLRLIHTSHLRSHASRINAYLGLDVGSISTNLVVLDEEKRVLSKRYLMTAGRPIEAIRRGLSEIGEEIGDKVRILGVGTTGSGRYMTGDFVGADIVKNEITAQATASVEIDSSVDTIFEIGGQDSKFISLKDGVVIDFEMNKVCAAGTGSFLEEQAERLGISIKDEFGDLCLKANHPCRLGERCTVFMETAVVSHQQKGAKKDDIVAGLGYSIVYNYLNKVVGDKKIGDRIFFQGGVAFNKGVVAAFKNVLGKKITVPPHHDVTGAIGMALIALRHMKDNGKLQVTRFKGFELSKRDYNITTFECKGCSNICEIKKVSIEGEENPLYYGSRCEKYDMRKKAVSENPLIADLFEERERIFFSRSYLRSPEPKARIGIPLTLYYYDHIPFLASLLTGLGFEVVLSDKTNREIIHKGVEVVLSEACFPQKVAHGHILNLIEKGVDAIFLPSFIDLSREGDAFERSVACPYAQTIPYVSKVAIGSFNIISPRINYRKGEDYIISELKKAFRHYRIRKADIRRALKLAEESQRAVHDEIERRGMEILDGLRERSIVIVGRPYNGCDRGVNLDLPKKLKDLGVLSIPMDFLPLSVDISKEWPNMYWRWGQKILQAGEVIKRHPFLNALFITNFGCGPDSFIIEYFKKIMGNKPFLQIEIDGHSADAGIITRCEAFLDSIKNVGPLVIEERRGVRKKALFGSNERRVIYLPKMADHAYALAAAFRACGAEAEVLPDPDIETVNIGRRYTSGKECYPCTITTGDFVKMVKGNGFNPKRSAFFMPSAMGPCRFGQYNVFQRLVLDELGYGDVPVYSPLQGSKFYKELGVIGDDFIRIAWQGILAVEVLIKALHERRPYEKNRGETEETYKVYLSRIAKEIERRNGRLITLLEEMRRDFDAIPIYKDIKKPFIGIVGEIFVRLNAFTNEDIIKKIEALGGEVWLAPFEEWMYYVNYMALDKAMAKRSYSDILNILLTRFIQKRIERRIARPFEGFLKSLHEPSTKELLKNASPYIHPSFEGEAILSIGKAVDLAKKGAVGIVNTMPFTCMPGTIVTALMKRFEEDYPDVACLHIAYDGQEHAGSDTKIEAFMFQAKELWKNKVNKSRT